MEVITTVHVLTTRWNWSDEFGKDFLLQIFTLEPASNA